MASARQLRKHSDYKGKVSEIIEKCETSNFEMNIKKHSKVIVGNLKLTKYKD